MNFRIYIFVIMLFSAGNALAAGKITVGAAVSMKDALEKIVASYEKENPGKAVSLNFGSTFSIARQIKASADIDVIISADAENIDRLVALGNIAEKTAVRIAGNEILLVTSSDKNNPLTNTMIFFRKKESGRIAICDSSVPIGNYAARILDHMKVSESMKTRTVIAENVRAAMALVLNGAAQAAFVYRTDYQLHPEKLRILALPDGVNVEAFYYAAPIKGSSTKEDAEKFVAFLSSDTSRKIFTSFGFKP